MYTTTPCHSHDFGIFLGSLERLAKWSTKSTDSHIEHPEIEIVVCLRFLVVHALVREWNEMMWRDMLTSCHRGRSSQILGIDSLQLLRVSTMQ